MPGNPGRNRSCPVFLIDHLTGSFRPEAGANGEIRDQTGSHSSQPAITGVC